MCAIYASIHPYGDVKKLIAWPANRRLNIDVSIQILERDLQAVNVEFGDVYLHIWHIALLLLFRLILFSQPSILSSPVVLLRLADLSPFHHKHDATEPSLVRTSG